MIWDMLSAEEKNHILLKLLVQVCKADHTLQVEEFAYMVHVCNKIGLDPELIRLFIKDKTDPNEIMPVDEHDRMSMLYHLLIMMASDHDVNLLEEQLIFKLAFRLGFHESMTRDFIEVVKTSKVNEMPVNLLLDVIRKHNN